MMLLLIPLLPFIGFLVNASIGRRLSKPAAGLVAVSVMVASFAVAVASVIQLARLPEASRHLTYTAFTWIASGDFTADFTLRVDPLSALMILVVTGIGSLIHIYSTSYMHEEPDAEYARYFSYLNLFAAFMLVLVLGSNFLVMFVGWEGVGLCSYLLIGFYYVKKSAADAGKKAFIVNRIGDFGFVLGVLMLFVHFRTIDFQEIAHAASMMSPELTFGTISLATMLLFVGATGKSAQIPLYVWLPDAMEGPTPVSALIHAATMVTAGVYMIGRNAVLFSLAPDTLMVVAVIGAATAFFAGTIGLVQNDIKRVLAYSTVSQLGYMFLAMGVGAYTAGIFHLYTHAFFKALLFLGSGAVIHALSGEQDIRNMGGLKDKLPITYWTFLIGSLAIAGVPFLSGFFSKDEILFKTFEGGHTILWVVGMLTSLMTATYMFRLVFLTFWGERRHAAVAGGADAPGHDAHGHDAHAHGGGAGHDAHGHGEHLHDAPRPMAFALIALTVGSILAGYIGLPHALGGANRLEQWLEPSLTAPRMETSTGQAPRTMEPAESTATAETEGHEQAEAGAGVELGLMGLSSVVAFAGIGLAWFFFVADPRRSESVAQSFSGLRTLLLNKYYVDEAYDAAVVQPIKVTSEQALWKVVDAGGIDGLVNGTADSVSGLGQLLRRLQTGSVRAYAASLLFGVVLVFGYYLWR
ncbi:MAG TPA: NADH-quinone oxidoreductase subunit L [Vicinamibacterales bacterium]|nr:NADH-quinone oxidoreductase subunit L [Vicinamibacterales bacterium]